MDYEVLQKPDYRLIASGREADDSVLLLEDNLYFTPAAVDLTHLVVTERTYTCPYKGVCYWLDLVMPEFTAKNIAWVYRDPKPGYERIQHRIAFYTRETRGTLAQSRMTAQQS